MNWLLLRNSILVAGLTTLGSVAIGGIAAVWAAALPRLARRLTIAAAVVALILPPFLVTNCWLDLLGKGGVLRAWVPFEIYSLPGTLWVLTLLLWPIPFLFVLAGLQRIEPSQLESEPALRGQVLVARLLLPAAYPALLSAAVFTFILAFNNFSVPAILQTKVFPAEVWVSFNTTFDYASSLTLSWPLLIPPLLLLLFASRSRTISWPRAESRVSARLFRRHLGAGWFTLGAVVSVVALLLSLSAPLGQLLFQSRTWLELPGALAAGHSAVLNSVKFAAGAATVSLGFALLTWRLRAGAVLWIPFLLPGVLLGIGLIFVFNRGPLVAFYQSAGIVITGLVLRYAILNWATVRQALLSADSRLLDWARLNGAGGWQRFWHVHWPQIASESGAGWLITYLLCLWDVETLVLVIPPGGETLAIRIFNLLHYGHNAQVNALCVLLLSLAVIPLAIWAVLGGSLRRWAPIAGVAVMLAASGCQPSTASNDVPINSRIFSRVQVIGSRGTALGQFNKPRSVAVDRNDNLYVVDMTGRVQKFSSNGVYLSFWQMPQTGKGKPKGMCRDADGNIVVVEPHYQRVNHFSPDGKLVAQWGQSGTNNGQLCLPRAAVVNSHGDLYVCEYTLVDRVQCFNPQGKAFRFAFGHSGLKEGEFNRPEGLGVDSADRLYVADSCNHRIQVFSATGQFLRTYGSAGSAPGELSYPYDILVDSDGVQYVAEFGNSRIQIFDAAGKSIEVIGQSGAAPGQFANPWSLALDSAGNLYVADSQNHRVQKLIRKEPRRAPAAAVAGSHASPPVVPRNRLGSPG